MTQYIVRRLIHAVFIVWGCATLVFFMIRLIPGDPVLQMLGPEYTPEAAEALRHKLGLDQPIYVRSGSPACCAATSVTRSRPARLWWGPSRPAFPRR